MNVNEQISVIIPRIDAAVWTGGELYYSNLKRIVGKRFPDVRFEYYDPGFQPVVDESFKARIRRKLTGRKYLEEREEKTESYFRSLAGGRRAVIFSNSLVAPSGKIPFIYWIPDFQFLHLPEFAPPSQIEAAKKHVKAGALRASLIMLSSNDASNDLRSFLPDVVQKARVVPFAKGITGNLLDADVEPIVRKYNLPARFFYMPNQFWIHKNHRLVIEALSRLGERGRDVTVVFSGNTSDFRNPGHFNQLLALVSEKNVRNSVIVLGAIPYAEVVALMRASLAVLNPSLFEGWSTTVEEVKSIGKKMLLSDLDVHREQAVENAVFFRRNDPSDLAMKMEEALGYSPGPDYKQEQVATEVAAAREKSFAENFVSLLQDAL